MAVSNTFYKLTVAVIAICLVLVFVIALITGMWVLTALIIGFLFGFFLEKSDLCGASAFSEVLLMRDGRKLFGLWVVIVTGMLGFSVLHLAGLIQLSPKPLLWANYLVGGIVFGVGTVLAGGCVSGTLFKTGQGNINSMAGLIGIPLGIALVEYGPLSLFNQYLLKHVVKNTEGGAVTLSSLTGIPYPLLALIIAAVTLVLLGVRRKNRADTVIKAEHQPTSFQRIMPGRWKPWQSGIAIGLLGCLAYMSSAASGRNYPLGVTHGVLFSQLLVTDYPLEHKWQKPSPPAEGTQLAATEKMAPKPNKKVQWWLILEVISLVIGAHVAARLSGKGSLQPRPPDETVIAFFGGILVGAGACLASGCVVGNIMSGWALMSVGNILFGVTTLLANWTTTYFYLMGGQWGK